jgi:glycosyltransferase involved in cell wall biosynthesis
VRVLIVSQYFWPERFIVNDLATALEERGHQVTVLTGKPNYPEGRFFPGYGFWGRAREGLGGILVVRTPLLPRGRGGPARLALNYLSFALLASLLGPLRLRQPQEVIFVFAPSPLTATLPALALRALWRRPVVLWLQDIWPDSVEALGGRAAAWASPWLGRLSSFLYRRCDRILVPSRAFVPRLRELGVPEARIEYLPNWAEDLYGPEEGVPLRGECEGFPQGFRVVFAGNLGAAQSLETLVEAAAALRDVKDVQWVVIGDGRRRPWLADQVALRGLGDTVHLLGSRRLEDMPACFAAADALLVTLGSAPLFALTIPSKIQSYLAAGRPIVGALDGEGASIVAEAEAGLTVPAGAGADLARAVLTLRDLPASERAAMGRRGRQYFDRHFRRDSLIARLETTMQEVRRSDPTP